MGTRCHERRDRGAAVVELALVLPLLVILAFGTITGGMAYNRNLLVSSTAEQAARHAATKALDGDVDTWLSEVHERVMGASDGELVAGTPGRRICVAYVDPDASIVRSRTVTSSDAAVHSASPCYADRLGSEARVQVSVSRSDAIDLVLGRVELTLSQDVTSRREVQR